jgi:hypothetical protein
MFYLMIVLVTKTVALVVDIQNMNTEHCINNSDRKSEVHQEKCVPVPLSQPQTPHGLSWYRTQAFTARSWQLTTGTVA